MVENREKLMKICVVLGIRAAWYRLARHARMSLDPKHCFLLEVHFVGCDNFPDGLARCGIVRMDKTQNIRRFADHFT